MRVRSEAVAVGIVKGSSKSGEVTSVLASAASVVMELGDG